MGSINTKNLEISGVTVGKASFLEDEQPSDVTINNRRYLQSGLIEIDESLFDTSIFTGKAISSGSVETHPLGVTTFFGAAFGAALFVIAGTAGNMATSPDSSTWTSRTSQFGASTIRKVKRLNGIFIAVGDAGKLSTSSDGITWTLQTTPNSDILFDVDFGGGLYVAVGTGSIITSPDFINWTSRSHGLFTGLRGVTFGNSTYVAVGLTAPNIQTSTDAITWVNGKNLPGGATSNGIEFGSNIFVAIASNSGNAYTTDDPTIAGTDFTSEPTGAGGFLTDVNFSDKSFYIVSETAGDLIISSGNGFWNNDGTLGSNSKGATAEDSGNLIVVGDVGDLISHTVTFFAGSTISVLKDGENQYIRIS